MNGNLWTRLLKAGGVFLLLALYLAAFRQWGAPILVIVPVTAAAFFFGTRGGWIAGIAAFFLNLFLVVQRQGAAFYGDIPAYEARNFFFFGHLLVLMAGISVGRLREMRDNRARAEAELAERARFFSALNKMTRSVMTAQNFEAMMQALTQDFADLLDADSCYITRWDAAKEQVFPVAASIEGHSFLSMEYPKGEKNLTVSALEAGRILLIDDSSDTEYSSPQIIGRFDEKAFISIPLIYGHHKIGAVIVGYNQRRRLAAEKLEQAEQAASQIALAIWNAQQEIQLQRSLREANALSNIALALSQTERVGLNDVLQLIVNSARDLIPNVEQAVIHLIDESGETLVYGAVVGFDDPAGGKKKMRVGEGAAGQAVLSGETLNIGDVLTDPRFLRLDTDPVYRSLMAAPVRSGDRTLGAISVSSSRTFAFGGNDIKLLSQLGIQAAIAIENAHLLESTQQALKEVNALYRINQGLVASLDADELFREAVELLQTNFGYYHVQVYVRDAQTDDFIMRRGSGEIGRRLQEKGHRMRAGEGIVGYAAETGEAFFTNNVDEVFFFTPNPLLPATKSELAVPVKIEGKIIGVLDIQQAPPALLSQRDLQLVSAVAGQLSVALQKADLYAELQAALQVEKAIRDEMVQSERLATMGRLLASVSHELNNPLQAIQNALFLLREEKGISIQGKLDLDIVLSEAERMAAMIERLRSAYRPIQAEDFAPTQLNDIIEDVYALISTHLRHNEIAFEFHPDANLPLIPALANQIRQVTLNLFMNAVEAMSDGGTLKVWTEYLRSSGEALLTVSDTGSGIPPELLPSIFDAFVTNKQRGTGLGLTISYDIIMKHRGRITAENNPDRGSTFRVWLPTRIGEGVS
jgi:signal transduction histidine kinase